MKAHVLKANTERSAPVARARGAHIAVLIGPEEGATRFTKRRFVLEPGGRIPMHRHPSIEHEQFVVEGSMDMGLDDGEVTVSAGDAIYIPAGVAHWYENRGSVRCVFLCTIPITTSYDTEWLEDPPDGAFGV